ncbi:PAB-dependent poly(A)-specific ribonuclease subunit 3 [Rhodotorula kratochvilovae]
MAPPGSAAIAIVRPPPDHPSLSPVPKAPSSPAKSENRLCRNLQLFGSCKYADRGCQFSHDLPGTSSKPATPAPPGTSSTPLSAAAITAAVFVPGGVSSSGTSDAGRAPPSGTLTPGGSAMAVQAAEFVPRRAATPALSEDAAFYAPEAQEGADIDPTTGYNKGMADVAQQNAEGLAEYYQQAMDLNAPEYGGAAPDSSAALHPYSFSHALAPPGANGGAPSIPGMSHAAVAAAEAAYYNNGMGAMQMGGMGHYVRQPLQYHLYHPLPSTNPRHLSSALSARTGSHSPTTSFFLPPALHISLTQKSEATQATPSVDMKLPEEVGGYTGLLPLDKPPSEGGSGGGGLGWAGFRGWVYKAWKEGEGRCYMLRRIEGFRLQHEAAIAAVEKWTRVRHPGLVGVREAFTTRAFGDQSIVFVYDFHPCSQTLYEAHLSPLATLPPNPWSTPLTHHAHHAGAPAHASPFRTAARPGVPSAAGGSSAAGSPLLPERVLWSYVVQLASALKCVHNSGLAVRTVDVNRVLVTGKNRVRLGGAGILDCLTWDGGQSIPAHQQDDLLSFGKLIIALACGSTSAVHNLPKSVDHISRMYSPDLKNIVLYLLSKPGPRKTIEEVLVLMGPRVVDELNSSLVAEDTIEHELMRELENGRLVRLLTKFGFINERPEFDHDPRWAETGDRYLIKLFRDYVFHQVDETGRPVTDLSHVLTALNKLDAGVDEKLMLVSRDEQSCLIVSYREAEEGGAGLADEVKDKPPATPGKKTKRPTRPYADPSQYAHLGDDPLPDYIEDGLAVLLCGINPGVKSAQLGLHYANPTNHYWKCLSESGMTPRLLHPSEGPSLPSFGIGSTNLVERPTAEMSEISNQEMAARVPGLLRKVVQYKPRIVALVGMKICEIVMRYLHNLPKPASSASGSPGRRKAMPKVKIGLQPVTISLGEGKQRIYVWCLPSTSARVVEYQLVDKIKIWKLLKADMDRLAQSPSAALELPEGTVEYAAESLFPPAGEVSIPSRYKVTLIKAEELAVPVSA